MERNSYLSVGRVLNTRFDCTFRAKPPGFPFTGHWLMCRLTARAYPAGLYAIWSGTSAAAALVSGEAASILAHKDSKTDEAAKESSTGSIIFTIDTISVLDVSNLRLALK
jgi:Subtilase family